MNMVLKNCFSPRKKIQNLDNIEGYTFICNGELDQNLPGIYGEYKLQCEQVNGRAYFKSGKYGLWWCTNGYWVIGNDNTKGQKTGFVYFKNNVLYPPHKTSEWTGRVSTNKGWINAGVLFDLKGKLKKNIILNYFYLKSKSFSI